MHEGPITHPGLPQEIYHKLGIKTLWIFILERSHAAFALFLVTIVLFGVSQQPFITRTPLGDLSGWTALATDICGLLFIVSFVIVFLVGWLIYINYKFCLGEDSLKIKRGILNKEEIAIPYRQIQDVDMRRDLAFQMFGLSRVVMLTAGQDIEKDEDSEGVLPALDKDFAEWLQAELLKRANVQKVVQVAASPEGK